MPVMGREYAAVAMAIVSTRPQEHFTSGPGGYFAGMLRKFEKTPRISASAAPCGSSKTNAGAKTATRNGAKPNVAPDRDEDQKIHASRSAIGPKLPGHGTGEQYKRKFCAGWQRSAVTANGLANAAGAAVAQQSLPSTSKDGQPSPELRGLQEEWIKSKLVNPKKN